MRKKFSSLAAAMLVGSSLANVASAHPGHSPADMAAQVSQPFAGADHFAAFVALTAVLLLTLRAVVKMRSARKQRVSR